MSFIYNMSDTWNAIGTTFDAIKMNISNGAGGAPVGAAASRAFNLQANGATIFDIDISGQLTQQFKNVLGAITTSKPATFTQTWNAGGVTFNGLFANITDTASAALSLPLNIQIGSVSKLSMNKAGFVGIGVPAATVIQTPAHIYKSASGVTADSRTVLALESASDTFLSLLTMDNAGGAVLFSSPTSAFNGLIYYDHITNSMDFRVNNNQQGLRLYASLGLAIGGTPTDPGAGMVSTNSATFMIRTRTAYTNGAGASGGTLLNSPAVGNPTKWIPVDDNGTTRYVPAW